VMEQQLAAAFAERGQALVRAGKDLRHSGTAPWAATGAASSRITMIR
jgi:hypothetical protein